MPKRTHNIAIVAGTYEKNGETKKTWMNVGYVIQWDNGDSTHVLNRTFNPAGAPGDPEKGVMLYAFPIEEKRPPQRATAAPEFDDDIPF